MLKNYWLIFAPRNFDVLKTNIYPRSEALRKNMQVLRTSNFQGQLSDWEFRQFITLLFYCSPLARQFKNHFQLFFNLLIWKPRKAKCKSWKKHTIPIMQFQLFIFYKPACFRKLFMDEYHPSGNSSRWARWADNVFLRMNTNMSPDQFKFSGELQWFIVYK